MPLIASAGDTSSGESEKNVPFPATIDEFLAALFLKHPDLSVFVASPSVRFEYIVEYEEGYGEQRPLMMKFPACFVSSAGHSRSYPSNDLEIVGSRHLCSSVTSSR